MRLSLRFVLPLILALAAFAYAVIPLVDRLTLRWFERDLDARATLIANASDETVQQIAMAGDTTRMLQLFARITQDERVYAVGFCASPESAPIATPTFSRDLECSALDSTGSKLLNDRNDSLFVSVRPIATDSLTLGRLILVHDLGFDFVSRAGIPHRQRGLRRGNTSPCGGGQDCPGHPFYLCHFRQSSLTAFSFETLAGRNSVTESRQ